MLDNRGENQILIIEIPYGGLGDHLFHSHIPRIAKETGRYDKIYISEFSIYRSLENKKIIWELNPFVDGFIEKHGKKIDIEDICKKNDNNRKITSNLLDEIMFEFGLDNGIRYNEPEIYYKPQYKEL